MLVGQAVEHGSLGDFEAKCPKGGVTRQGPLALHQGQRVIGQVEVVDGGTVSDFLTRPVHRGVDGVADKGRHGGSGLKQVGMVAHFPQLHEDVDDGEEVAGLEGVPGVGPGHEVVVEEALPLRQRTPDDVLVLFRQLLFHLALEATQQKGAEHLVQPLDQAVVVLGRALDHSSQGIGKPFLEVTVRFEDVGHEEVHEGPELHQVVLKGRSRQEQAPGGLEVEEELPPLGLEVLDVLRLVQDQVVPLLATETAKVKPGLVTNSIIFC